MSSEFNFGTRSVLKIAIRTLALLLFSHNVAIAKYGTVRRIGDTLQIINPLVVAYTSYQEDQFKPFVIVYGESLAAMGAIKLVGKASKWSISRRPSLPGRKDNFNGFPSGHTTSAWAPAAYNRVFSNDYQLLTVPLYLTAAFTGYSRVQSRRHTKTQVIAAAILSEGIVAINHRLKINNEHRAVNLSVAPDESKLQLAFRF